MKDQTRQMIGFGFCAIAAFLFAARYLSAAIFGKRLRGHFERKAFHRRRLLAAEIWRAEFDAALERRGLDVSPTLSRDRVGRGTRPHAEGHTSSLHFVPTLNHPLHLVQSLSRSLFLPANVETVRFERSENTHQPLVRLISATAICTTRPIGRPRRHEHGRCCRRPQLSFRICADPTGYGASRTRLSCSRIHTRPRPA
jgi:hypothetical protein